MNLTFSCFDEGKWGDGPPGGLYKKKVFSDPGKNDKWGLGVSCSNVRPQRRLFILYNPSFWGLKQIFWGIDPVLVEVTGRYVHNKHQQILRIYKMPKSIYSQYLFIIDKTL